MTRLALLLISMPCLLTGCYTHIQAPGAVGKLINADTGAPVRGAQVTRTFVAGGVDGRIGVPWEGLPAVTSTSDENGRFELPPAMRTEFVLFSLRNPESIRGAFVISDRAYTTNEVQGVATSRTRWRVDLGRVLLKRP